MSEDEVEVSEESSQDFFEKHKVYVESVILFVLTSLTVLSAHVFPLSVESFVSLDFSGLLGFVSLSALFFVVPVVYATYISLDSFVYASFSSVIGVSGFLLGVVPGAVGASVFATCLIVSKTVSNNFNGENYLSVFYSSGGVFATFLAVVLAFSIGFSLAYVPENSSGLRGSLVSRMTGTAESLAGRTISEISDVGADRSSEVAGEVAQASSVMAIRQTRENVFASVFESGLFDQEQVAVLELGFSDSLNTVPMNVSESFSETASEQVSGEEIVNQSIGDAVEPVVEDVVSRGFERRELVFAGVFLFVFPVMMLFKLPFKLLSLLYGRIIIIFTSEQ